MKRLLFILFFLFIKICAFTQTDSSHARDTINKVNNTIAAPKYSISRRTFDTAKRNSVITRAKKPFVDTVRRKIIADSIKRMDSIAKTDSLPPVFLDSVKNNQVNKAKNNVASVKIKKPIDSIYLKLLDNPFITKAKPIFLVIHERNRDYKDEIFYLICGLLLFLAFIKLIFSRYFKNIFRLFFQPAFRQKQTREQLLQSNLPSLLLNLFFIFSSGTYITFLLKYYHHADLGFWSLLAYTNASLLALYLGKFIFLSFAGWVFDAKEATDAYIFAVNLINKIVGVILIPFTLVIAFSQPQIINTSVTIAILIISLLFVYRYLVSYPAIRRELKVSLLHFFFYVLAFEIMPLLLIYKTLIIFLNNSH